MNYKTWLLTLLISIFFTATAHSSIGPQMVNLNMQFRSHEQTIKSDLSMPLYQTAEIEKKFGKKNYLISFNPKQGKKSDEVNIEVKFLRPSNSKVFYKKEIVAKINQQTIISAKGMVIQLTPVI
jgi:hypothetical protein